MLILSNAIIVVVLALNLFALGTSRMSSVIRVVGWQGVALGCLAPLAHPEPRVYALALGMVLLKGRVIPAILREAMREAEIRHEVEPIIGLLPTVLLGALATGLFLFLAGRLPLLAEHDATLLVPASFSTLAAGFLLLVTRVKAINQVIGYLLLENGIFLFGLLLVQAVPFLVELGILLDLFVGVFVVSIILHHIQRSFTSLDTRKLTALKD